MDHNTFLVTVFTIVDDWLKTQPSVRSRGPRPTLADSEVLTIEVVGAFLGISAEKELYTHFCRHYREWFPLLPTVHRTTFTRQAANLWQVKQSLWQHILTRISYNRWFNIVDSFPVPVCRYARAFRCKRIRDWSDWGYDDVAGKKFLGLRAHVRICWPGVIVGLSLRPANLHDRWEAEELLTGASGWVIGDTNYSSPDLKSYFAQQNLTLVAPPKTSVARFKHPWPRWLIQIRRRVETVIGQLVDRYDKKRVRAMDSWHLCSRWIRAVLSHTFAVYLCQQAGLESPTRFADLLTD